MATEDMRPLDAFSQPLDEWLKVPPRLILRNPISDRNLGLPPKPVNKTPSSPAARAALRTSAWHQASGLRLLRRHHVSRVEVRHARLR